MTVQRKPLIVRLQSGTGNQLYQYAAGYSLSKKFHRPLLIDRTTIAPEYPARHYALNAFEVESTFVSGLTAFSTRWAASQTFGTAFRTLFPPASGYIIFRDNEKGYEHRFDDPPEGHLILQGYWQSFRYFTDYENELRQLFRFKNTLTEANALLASTIINSNSVSVHIRRGDYVSNPVFAENLGACDSEYYKRALGKIAIDLSEPKLFVFTDDPTWAKSAINWPADTTHVDENLGHADIADLHLMSLCRHNIIANSSFSWWGAWLGNQPNKLVIAPKTWFKNDATPIDDRLPPHWHRL
jgi:hypothetical protein